MLWSPCGTMKTAPIITIKSKKKTLGMMCISEKKREKNFVVRRLVKRIKKKKVSSNMFLSVNTHAHTTTHIYLSTYTQKYIHIYISV